MVVQVTDATFEAEVLKADKPVLVDCYADWCGPCKMMAPVIDEVAVEMEGKAKVYKLDVDEAPQIAQAYRVMSVPTFIVFKNGQPAAQTIGGQAKEGILALFG